MPLLIENNLKEILDKLVNKYEQTDFINNDPIRFPHKFSNDKDIEISGFLASIFSYGNRKIFTTKLDELFKIMGNQPLEYISNYSPRDKSLDNFNYRFSKGCDIKEIVLILQKLYTQDKSSLKELFSYGWNIDNTIPKMLINVCDYFYTRIENPVTKGFYHLVPNAKKNSALKRMNMYLRWMVRDGKVDFGIWNFIPKSELIIPLDTHVAHISQQLGLIEKSQGTLKTAIKITDELKKFDANDPVKYDFALFGYGIANSNQ